MTKVNQAAINDKWMGDVGNINDKNLRLFNASISTLNFKISSLEYKILITNTSHLEVDNNLCIVRNIRKTDHLLED